jgi:putative SOS response-associated peptidase YedK
VCALVVADGFYEWTTGSDGRKEPVHFHLRRFEPFAFAGLCTGRIDEASGKMVDSFTIITTRPNVLVASVHDRMPVILTPEVEDVWLDPSISKEHALSLLRPFPTELMGRLPALPRVNSIRDDDPGLLVRDDILVA